VAVRLSRCIMQQRTMVETCTKLVARPPTVHRQALHMQQEPVAVFLDDTGRRCLGCICHNHMTT
jgi:hypothetical protein